MISGRCVHFIAFKDDRYWNAVRIWGRPDFIHRVWDKRAQREIDYDSDVLIFAEGDEHQPPAKWNGADIDERFLL